MGSESIDTHVGKRLRQRRSMLGMSQEEIGSAVGVTFQQIQKYERGVNRIGSGRLFEFAKILNVPISYFFEEVGATTDAVSVAEESKAYEADPMNSKETLALVRAYYRIPDPVVRKRVMSLIKSLAAGSGEDASED